MENVSKLVMHTWDIDTCSWTSEQLNKMNQNRLLVYTTNYATYVEATWRSKSGD